jgi:hypothetical protein
MLVHGDGVAASVSRAKSGLGGERIGALEDVRKSSICHNSRWADDKVPEVRSSYMHSVSSTDARK